MATARNEGSFLAALPMELLERITADLDEDCHAILNIRLTCKTLEAATFDCFAEKFFASHQFCILYRVSLLRLYDLLARSSRLIPKMRTITFTSCFFANMKPDNVKLALNQYQMYRKSAQIAAMNAYSESHVEMLQPQMLPDARLIRDVLVALKANCPGVEVKLDILRNAKPSISVHVQVFEAVADLGVALTSLTVDPTTLNAGNFGTLESRLPTYVSSLVKFCFGITNTIGAEAERQLPVGRIDHLLPRVLGSANDIRDLTLNFNSDHPIYILGKTLTFELLRTNSYPMLQSLSLSALSIPERMILNALADWGGQLEKVKLSRVYLIDVEGEGWSDVLRALAALPKLCQVSLYILRGGRNNPNPDAVDLRNLKHGQTTSPKINRKGPLKTHNHVLFCNDEVAAGLRELLQRGLKYF